MEKYEQVVEVFIFVCYNYKNQIQVTSSNKQTGYILQKLNPPPKICCI